ncbi:MAG: (2Fe-2S)-binding protein [Spirochaetales bacterium]|nr:(2Fe-2S)-binding protein [Spirochaetales bacterium]
MAEEYTITVNGTKRTVVAEPKTTLVTILRREFGLLGTKQGCDNGTCGACTVVMNGKAVKSCVQQIGKIDGAEITTVEGLAKGTEVHPIQRALIDAGAVQCGFCTPGIVMELHATLSANPEPSDEELFKGLNKHLCRCTGYEAIMEGARLAMDYLKAKKG